MGEEVGGGSAGVVNVMSEVGGFGETEASGPRRSPNDLRAISERRGCSPRPITTVGPGRRQAW